MADWLSSAWTATAGSDGLLPLCESLAGGRDRAPGGVPAPAVRMAETRRLQALGAGWQTDGQKMPPLRDLHAAPATVARNCCGRSPRDRRRGPVPAPRARWRLATAAGVVACALFAGWPGAIASMSMPPASAPRSCEIATQAPAGRLQRDPGRRQPDRGAPCRWGAPGGPAARRGDLRGRTRIRHGPFVVATDG